MKNTSLLILFILFLSSYKASQYCQINLFFENNYKIFKPGFKTVYKVAVKDSLNKFKFITIGNLDVMTSDLGFYNVKEAEEKCRKLNDGWRLPNETELNVIFEQNEKLGNFETNYYLGMDSGTDAYNENVIMYLRISILSGEVVLLQSDQELFSQYGVRAVRNHISHD